MSRTIGSPARITRSDASWCGEAELGPDATIANSAWSWPSARSRSRTSRATSASVRPTSGPAAIWSTTRSAASAARRSSVDLVGVLRHPERPERGRGRRERRGRQRGLEAEQVERPEAVRDADAGRRGAPRPVRVGRRPPPDPRFGPGRDRDVDPAAGLAPRAARAAARRASRDPAARPTTSIVSRSRCVGVVAGEVAEVRPDADEQRVEARPRPPHVRPRRAVPRSARRGSPVASATVIGRPPGPAAPARTRSSPGRPRTACGTRGPCRRRRRGRACGAPGRRAARRRGPAGSASAARRTATTPS